METERSTFQSYKVKRVRVRQEGIQISVIFSPPFSVVVKSTEHKVYHLSFF